MPVEKSTVDTIRKERGTVLKEGYIQKLGGNKQVRPQSAIGVCWCVAMVHV